MVSRSRALGASFISAVFVAVIHGAAHEFFGTGPDAVVKVGFTVLIATFAIAYWGMTRR